MDHYELITEFFKFIVTSKTIVESSNLSSTSKLYCRS